MNKLTDAQRESITNCPDDAAWHAGCEALYLIDAQAAEIESLRSKLSALGDQILDGAKENERLRAELAHITGLLDEADAALERPSRRELAAESRVRELAAVAFHRESRITGLKSRLATAVALLTRCAGDLTPDSRMSPLYNLVSAFLAGQTAAPECNYVGRCNSSRCPVHGQPAAPTRSEPKARECGSVGGQSCGWAPTGECLDCSGLRCSEYYEPAAPTRTEAETVEHSCPSCGDAIVLPRVTRTEAEQAVLDAMRNVNTAWLEEVRDTSCGPLGAACRAELARRGLK